MTRVLMIVLGIIFAPFCFGKTIGIALGSDADVSVNISTSSVPSATTGTTGNQTGNMQCRYDPVGGVSITACQSHHAEYLAKLPGATCTLNGESVTFPYNRDGLSIDVYWRSGGAGVSSVTGDRYTGVVGSSTTDTILTRATWTGGSVAYTGSPVINISCSQDVKPSGLRILKHGSTAFHATGVLNYKATINITNEYQISVTQPEFIRGRVGSHVHSRFFANPLGATMSVSWSIGSPCSNWNPVLAKSSNPDNGIRPGTSDGFMLDIGDNELVATFLPGLVGEFTCYATLTATAH